MQPRSSRVARAVGVLDAAIDGQPTSVNAYRRQVAIQVLRSPIESDASPEYHDAVSPKLAVAGHHRGAAIRWGLSLTVTAWSKVAVKKTKQA